MGRFVERVQALGAQRAALLLAAAALAAALSASACMSESSEVGAVVAQERQTVASQQSEGAVTEPLTLTLSAPEICEAQHPHGGWDHGLAWNEEEQVWEDIEADAWWYWGHEGTVEVDWTASGGDGAYTVTIAGEAYTGARYR